MQDKIEILAEYAEEIIPILENHVKYWYCGKLDPYRKMEKYRIYEILAALREQE